MAWIAGGGKNAEVAMQAASCYAGAGAREKAAAAIGTALALPPPRAPIHYDAGVVYQQLGMWPEAVAMWKEALELDGDHISRDTVEKRLAEARAKGFE